VLLLEFFLVFDFQKRYKGIWYSIMAMRRFFGGAGFFRGHLEEGHSKNVGALCEKILCIVAKDRR
jgi:hypothetical protein